MTERIEADVERQRVAVLVDGPLTAITTTRRERQPGVEGKGARIFMLQRGTILLYPHDPSRRTWPADARAASARRSAPARSSATTRRRGRPPGTESRLSHGRAQARFLQSPLGGLPSGYRSASLKVFRGTLFWPGHTCFGPWDKAGHSSFAVSG